MHEHPLGASQSSLFLDASFFPRSIRLAVPFASHRARPLPRTYCFSLLAAGCRNRWALACVRRSKALWPCLAVPGCLNSLER
ncbi:hypothetical protein EMIT048CA2_40403 [Pseudomonas chlororaphis]